MGLDQRKFLNLCCTESEICGGLRKCWQYFYIICGLAAIAMRYFGSLQRYELGRFRPLLAQDVGFHTQKV